jgi:hypothetical protein
VLAVAVVRQLARPLHTPRLPRLPQPRSRNDDRVGREARNRFRHLHGFLHHALVRLAHFVDDVEAQRFGGRQLAACHGDLRPDLQAADAHDASEAARARVQAAAGFGEAKHGAGGCDDDVTVRVLYLASRLGFPACVC